MNNLEQYVMDATRTESIPERLIINKENFVKILDILIITNELLDGIKKGLYYNDWTKLTDTFSDKVERLKSIIDELNDININKQDPEHLQNVNIRVAHGIIGMSTESGELLEILRDMILTGEFDTVNLGEELGDLSWYQAIIVDDQEMDWETVLSTNIAKLKKRFPEKFDIECAKNRDLDSEREILEGK